MTEPVRAVLLDLYDTLACADWVALEAARFAAAAAVGVDGSAFVEAMANTEARRFRGQPGGLVAELAAVLRDLGVPAEPDLLTQLAELDRAAWVRGLRLYDDALPAIRDLRRHSRVAIVSNCGYQTAAWVEAVGLAYEVDAVVLSCEVGALKPEPAIFRAALERLGVASGEAALVDDLAVHLDAARALGMRTVQVVRVGIERPLSDHPRIRSLQELSDLLAG